MLAVSLVNQLNNLFAKKINFTYIFQYPTIEKFSEFLNAKSTDIQYLTTIQSKGELQPLFLFPPAGGTSLPYLGLKNLITDRPIYGFNNPNFGEKEDNLLSIEENSDSIFLPIPLSDWE